MDLLVFAEYCQSDFRADPQRRKCLLELVHIVQHRIVHLLDDVASEQNGISGYGQLEFTIAQAGLLSRAPGLHSFNEKPLRERDPE